MGFSELQEDFVFQDLLHCAFIVQCIRRSGNGVSRTSIRFDHWSFLQDEIEVFKFNYTVFIMQNRTLAALPHAYICIINRP